MKQDILEVSRTPLYPAGKRIELDERVFRYCKSGLTYLGGFRGWGNGNHTSLASVLLSVEAPVGSTSLLVTDAIGAAAHDYKDGWLTIENAVVGPISHIYRIKDNDATIAGVTKVYLYRPTRDIVPIPVTSLISIHKNIYSKCMRIGINEAGVAIPDFRTVVCVPWINLTLGDYFWGQTWGPCFGYYSIAEPGIAQNRRNLYFSSDGSLITADELVAPIGSVHAGVILPETDVGISVGGGGAFYRLELAP